MPELVVARSLPDRFRTDAAHPDFAAFWPKLRNVLGHDRFAAVADLAAQGLRVDRAIAAHDGARLLGVTGFKRGGAGLVDLTPCDLRRLFGWWGGSWRGVALGLLDRHERPGELLMDGICVAEFARGRGIGTRLLAAVEAEARREGASRLRLDVIDTNPRARALYERQGFRAARTRRMGPLGALFGFSAATEMHKDIGGTP